MDEETLEKAVTPFFTNKGISKGAGLGSPMIQGSMAQPGGALVLKSRKGEGTIAAPPGSVGPASHVAPEPVPLLERSLTVLAVDDDGSALYEYGLNAGRSCSCGH